MTSLKKITFAVEPEIHQKIKKYAVSNNVSIKDLILNKLFDEIPVNNSKEEMILEKYNNGYTRHLTDEIVEKVHQNIVSKKLARGENVILSDELGIYYLQKDGSKKYIED